MRSANSNYILDVAALIAAVDVAAEDRGLTIQQVAAETGVLPSTFSRMRQGSGTDVHALLTLLVWLNAPAAEFTALRVRP